MLKHSAWIDCFYFIFLCKMFKKYQENFNNHANINI